MFIVLERDYGIEKVPGYFKKKKDQFLILFRKCPQGDTESGERVGLLEDTDDVESPEGVKQDTTNL